MKRQRENSARDVAGQAVRYLLFSGLAFCVNIGSRLLFSGQGMPFIPAVALAYAAGMGVNFALNRRFNFPASGRSAHREAVTFLFIALFGLVLTTGLSAGLFRLFTWIAETRSPAMLRSAAHLCAVAMVAAYSFFGHKYFTYRGGLRAGLAALYQRLVPGASIHGRGDEGF